MAHIIKYLLSEEGRRKSLAAGGDGGQRQIVEVPPDSPLFQRLLILGTVKIDGVVVLDLTNYLPVDYEASATGACKVYKDYEFDAPQTVTELVAWEEARRARMDAGPNAELLAKSEHQREKAEAENQKWCEKFAAGKAQEEAKRKAKEEAKAAYNADRVAWIEKHGSAHLKALVNEGIPCDLTYRNERLAAERPGWQWFGEVCGEAVPIRDASPSAIAALAEARKTAPDARLFWLEDGKHVCNADDDDDGYDDEGCDFKPGPAVLAEFLGRKIVIVL